MLRTATSLELEPVSQEFHLESQYPVKTIFKFHHLVKNCIINTPYFPHWLTRVFGHVDGLLVYWLYSSRFCPTPHKPFRYIATFLQPGDVYIDIGASFGQMVAVAQIAVGKRGHVYAFEPQTTVFQRLVHIKDIFGWDNVTLIRSLVGNRNGECILYENTNSRVSSIFRNWERGKPGTYPITTLDEWTARNELTAAYLIKVDVEGAELQVIQGSRRFLAQAKPILILEINNRVFRQQELGYTVDDLMSELRKLGYEEFYVLRPEGLAPFVRSQDLLESDCDMLAMASN